VDKVASAVAASVVADIPAETVVAVASVAADIPVDMIALAAEDTSVVADILVDKVALVAEGTLVVIAAVVENMADTAQVVDRLTVVAPNTQEVKKSVRHLVVADFASSGRAD